MPKQKAPPVIVQSVRFPQLIVDAIAAMGFMTHFDAIAKGVLDIRDFLYFVVFIAAWLLASAIVIEMKKAN